MGGPRSLHGSGWVNGTGTQLMLHPPSRTMLHTPSQMMLHTPSLPARSVGGLSADAPWSSSVRRCARGTRRAEVMMRRGVDVMCCRVLLRVCALRLSVRMVFYTASHGRGLTRRMRSSGALHSHSRLRQGDLVDGEPRRADAHQALEYLCGGETAPGVQGFWFLAPHEVGYL